MSPCSMLTSFSGSLKGQFRQIPKTIYFPTTAISASSFCCCFICLALWDINLRNFGSHLAIIKVNWILFCAAENNENVLKNSAATKQCSFFYRKWYFWRKWEIFFRFFGFVLYAKGYQTHWCDTHLGTQILLWGHASILGTISINQTSKPNFQSHI